MESPLTSARFRNAFKTAVAIVLAYGFALWFDWGKPMWAVFAVALISLPTLGASLNKGAQRLEGTLVATVVALLLIALYAQDRWAFLLAQAGWLAFCTYRMTVSDRDYFWFCAAFVSAIITANGGPDPVHAFSVAVMRTLETSLGIICFALVFSLLWPVRGDDALPGEADEAPAVPPRADRLNQSAWVFIGYSIGFLAVLYVPGFPGSYAFLGMLAPFAVILATTPGLPVSKVLLPASLAILAACPVYMLLMPLLSGFAQLAPVIFAMCFAICYVLHTPEQGLARIFGLAFFAITTGISNEQSYSFLSVANTALMFSLVLLIMHVARSITVFVEKDAGEPNPAVETN